MVDFIIIVVIIMMILIGIRSSVKHFKGQGGCCGGTSYKTKKKKLHNIVTKKTFTVEGIHCKNCKNRVEEIVGDIDGVAGEVNLKRGELTVSYEKKVDDEIIITRIDKAGYRVKNIN